MTNNEEIIVSFLNEQFGGMMGGILLKNYLKSYNISSLSGLSADKQVTFAESMLRTILSKHLPSNKVEEVVMRLKLNFSLSKSLDSLSMKSGNDVILESISIANHDIEKIDALFDPNDKSSFSVKTNISGDYIGSTVLLVPNDEIPNLRNIIGKRVSFADDTDMGSMDNPQLLIKTFFSKLVPSMTYEVGAYLNKQIWFTEPEVDLEHEKNFMNRLTKCSKASPDLKNVVSRALSTGFGVKFNDVRVAGLFVFLEQKSPGLLDNWMKNVEETIISKGRKEETMQQIAKEEIAGIKISTGEKSLHYRQREDLIKLIGEYKGEAEKIFDKILKEYDIPSLELLEDTAKLELIEIIIETAFRGSSPQVTSLIRTGCQQILKVRK